MTALIAVPPKSQFTFNEWINAARHEGRNRLLHDFGAFIYRYG
jgi:hypothetical protein